MNIVSLLTLFVVSSVIFTSSVKRQEKESLVMKNNYTLVIHGGAGNITREHMTAEREKQYEEKMQEALEKGFEVLEKGGTGLDAVEVAIRILEDSPLFNAGKGSVLTMDGHIEMDASVMDGRTLDAGAVAGVTTIRNPISAARRVMEKSPHVLLIKEGAEQFAREQGIKMEDPSYFFTDRRKNEWKNIQKSVPGDTSGHKLHLSEDLDKHGTVGAVALDRFGNVYAGTSTGGMANKKYGRVGDSPIIGAGTYANNSACAVSCTGHGEYFIRLQAAKEVASLMEYKKLSVQEAARTVIHKKLTELGGTGGLIAVDTQGNFAMFFNTSGMFRGYINKEGSKVEMYQ